jgi:hypothetical protein
VGDVDLQRDSCAPFSFLVLWLTRGVKMLALWGGGEEESMKFSDLGYSCYSTLVFCFAVIHCCCLKRSALEMYQFLPHLVKFRS